MTGRWYIDNTDIYTDYGVGVTENGFNDLFLFPALVTPYSNDWPEQNGIQVNLSNPLLQNKNVGISFASITKDNVNVDNFLSFLTTEGYRELDIRSLGRTFQLRPSAENNRVVYNNVQTFDLQFVDDFPRGQFFETYKVWGSQDNKVITTENGLKAIIVDGESILIKPQGHGFGNLPASGYLLDGVRLDEYGIVVEQGKAEVYKTPALKQNLTRSISDRDSVIYDTGIVRFQSKDVTLKCALYCDTIERFWSNYMAFFSDLTKPKERHLAVGYANDSYPCFYKNMSNPIFYRGSGYVLLKFDLTLTFTRFTPLKTVYVWGVESKQVITTEDGINVIKYE